jgi:hypothetical protein
LYRPSSTQPTVPRRDRLIFATALLAGLGAASAAFAAPARAQSPATFTVFLPASAHKAGFPSHNAPLQASPTATAPSGPTATRTPRGIDTPGPSPTVRVDATRTPTPQPTVIGGHVGHPTGSDTIVLQIGQTETDEPDSAFEELNGTRTSRCMGTAR